MGFFVKVPEGKVKLLMAPGGKFVTELISWKDHFVCAEDKVVDGKLYRVGDVVRCDGAIENELEAKEISPVFGNYFFKVPAWHSTCSYSIHWSKEHYRGKPDAVATQQSEKKEVLSDIDLKEQYFRSYIKRTTGAGSTKKNSPSSNRVEVKVQYLVVLRVVNPYNFIFYSPSNSYDGVLEILDNLIGDVLANISLNLAEKLQGGRDALWYGLQNPDNCEYGLQNYPELSKRERKDLEKKHRELWDKYKDTLSYPDKQTSVFRGLKFSEEITKEFPEWGIEITRVEIIDVTPPEEVLSSRQQLVAAEIEKELATIQKKTATVAGGAERERIIRELTPLPRLIKKLTKLGLAKSKASQIAQEVFESFLAGEKKGNLEKKIFKGLEGSSVASLAAQWQLGSKMAGSQQSPASTSAASAKSSTKKTTKRLKFKTSSGKWI